MGLSCLLLQGDSYHGNIEGQNALGLTMQMLYMPGSQLCIAVAGHACVHGEEGDRMEGLFFGGGGGGGGGGGPGM